MSVAMTVATNGLNEYPVYTTLIDCLCLHTIMQEDAYDWSHFWEWKSDDWLDGYCFGEGTTFFERDYVFGVHWHNGEMILTFDEDLEGEEE